MKQLVCTLSVLFLLVSFQSAEADTTYVSGGIYTSNLTWSAAGSPYVVQGSITLQNAKLTIYPGTKVLFASTGLRLGRRYMCGNYTCNGWGELQAIGTPDSQIVFTSLSGEANGWHGIYFYYTNDVSGHTSRLEHCVVENAGLSGWGASANIYCDGSSQPSLSNCTIRNAPSNGLYLSSSSIKIDSTEISGDSIGVYCLNSWPTIRDGVIADNVLYGIYLAGESFPNLEGNTYSNNGHGIVVGGGEMTELNGTWHNDNGEPYVIKGSLRLRNSSITVDPGTWALFDGTGLQLGNQYMCGNYTCKGWAELNAIGTPDSQIVFSSLSGETNGWSGIYFYYTNHYDGHSSRLEHCIVEKAGIAGYGVQANIYSNKTSQPSLSNCIVRDATGSGLYLNSSSIKIDSTEISGDSIGVRCVNSWPTIRDGVFADNVLYGIYLV